LASLAMSAARTVMILALWAASLLVSGFFLWLGFDLQWYASSLKDQLEWYAVVGLPLVVTGLAFLIRRRRGQRKLPDLVLISGPVAQFAFLAVGTAMTKL